MRNPPLASGGLCCAPPTLHFLIRVHRCFEAAVERLREELRASAVPFVWCTVGLDSIGAALPAAIKSGSWARPTVTLKLHETFGPASADHSGSQFSTRNPGTF
jgi:hypothetical protein